MTRPLNAPMSRAELPPKNIKLVDESGQMSSGWYKSIMDIYQFSGLAGANFPLYQDAVVSGISMRAGPTGQPVLEPISPRTMAMAFDPSTPQYLHFSVQMPHGYVPGTDLRPYVQWAPENAIAGNVVWSLDATWTNVNEIIGAETLFTGVSASSAAGKKLNYVELLGPSGNAIFNGKTSPIKNFSSVLTCRIFRDSGNVNDTYTGKAFLLSCGFHFQNAAHGTVTTWVKGA